MNRFRLQAFCQEFPFLEKLFPEIGESRSLAKIKINRTDQNLVIRTPSHYSCVGSMGSITIGEAFSFVTEDGTIFENCVRQDYESESNYACDQGSKSDGEQIIAAIDRLGIKDIKYIVEHSYDYNSLSADPIRRTWSIIIYKCSKNDILEDILSSAKREAAEAVKAEGDI